MVVKYIAFTWQGDKVEGVLDVEQVDEARELLQQDELIPYRLTMVRQRRSLVQLAPFLFKPKPKDKASMLVVIEHLHQMEDNPELFREAVYALSQVDPLLFTKIAANARGAREGYEVGAKILIGQGKWIQAIKLIREVTGMTLKEAKAVADRMRENAH